MRILIAVFALFVAGAQAQPLADPLAPARGGMVACNSPDTASRTCRGITAYVFNADGTMTTITSASLQDSPPMVMHMSQPISMRDDGVSQVLSLRLAEAVVG